MKTEEEIKEEPVVRREDYGSRDIAVGYGNTENTTKPLQTPNGRAPIGIGQFSRRKLPPAPEQVSRTLLTALL